MVDVGDLLKMVSLEKGLEERPSRLNHEKHDAIVSEICCLFTALKKEQRGVPDTYRPGGEWDAYINERRGLYDKLLAGDVEGAGLLLSNFWRNELAPIVKEYAKYEDLKKGSPEFVERFLQRVGRNYLVWKDLFGLPQSVLEVPGVGNPWGLFIEDLLVVPKATRYYTHATQITSIIKGLRNPVVAEIGAGYGGMAYYLLKLAKGITYLDFDLPETLVLAAYYIKACLPEKKVFLFDGQSLPNKDDIQKYDALFLPNYLLPQLPDELVDVFFNTFSLSEMPMATLREYIGQIQRTTRKYFLHNNMDRWGVVNRGFERIPASAYPVDGKSFKMIYKHFDLFHGHDGDYREYLYEKIQKC